MLTKLMDVKRDKLYTPTIEILGAAPEVRSEMEFNWEIEQGLPKELGVGIGLTSKYGFNNLYSGLGPTIEQVAQEILDVSDIDQSTLESRRQMAIDAETDKFDPNYYMYLPLTVGWITRTRLHTITY